MDSGRTLFDVVNDGDDKLLNVILLEGKEERNVATLAHGNTVLHEAAWKGFSRCVKTLCNVYPSNEKDLESKKSKFINRANFCGFTALHLAAQNGHNQTIRELLYCSSCNMNVHNDYGDTPLHVAARYGHANALRILLSARCDVDSFNLNHDTPLHITCAMGRRKLTKILMEAGAMQFKNLQNETPRDIAMRKNLVKILDILSNYNETDRRKSKNSKSRHHKEGKRNWSPYGCHYFPDPRNFPSPKLETLPKEPLLKGEQYYQDLAGNIRKGPIGIGNVCFCVSSHKEIPNQNCKNIRKYVDKANEKLDKKVITLAQQIEVQRKQKMQKKLLLRNMKEENKKIDVEKWLKRGVKSRATIGDVNQAKDNCHERIMRCRSLELVDDNENCKNEVGKTKSVDLMNEPEEDRAKCVMEYYEDEEEDDEVYSNSISQNSTNSAHRNSLYNESFLLNFQQQQKQQMFPTSSHTESITSPSLSSNNNSNNKKIELEMDKIMKSLLGTSLMDQTKNSPDVINDLVKYQNVIKSAVTKPIMPASNEIYVNTFFNDQTDGTHSARIKNSQIKSLKTEQSAKSLEVEQLVSKVQQTIVNASNISSIHPTNVEADEHKYFYSGMSRVRNPLPMNIDEIETYTKNFFDNPLGAQMEDEHRETSSLTRNDLMLLEHFQRQRQHQQTVTVDWHQGESSLGIGMDRDQVQDSNNNEEINITASSLV